MNTQSQAPFTRAFQPMPSQVGTPGPHLIQYAFATDNQHVELDTVMMKPQQTLLSETDPFDVQDNYTVECTLARRDALKRGISALFLATTTSIVLLGCGQKGPLYIEGQDEDDPDKRKNKTNG